MCLSKHSMERLALLWLIINWSIISVLSQAALDINKRLHNVRMVYVDFPYVPPQEVPVHQHLQTDCYRSGFAYSPHICLMPPVQKLDFHTAAEGNPLLAALLLSTSLGLHPKAPGFNHPEHLPINPYVALLLSHYGRYAPVHGTGKGIYGYAAANNYHNNKPFGAYKIYEDSDG